MLENKLIKRIAMVCSVVLALILIKVVWIVCATNGQGSFEGERKEIVHRANYLTSKVVTSPHKLLNEMPSGIDTQFQGEWALYSCSMTSSALANISILYPHKKDMAVELIGKIIDIAMSEEIREYDKLRWGEDPMEGIYGNLSHISYYSHLAWMISRYKQIGGDGKYDELYHTLCDSMNRRICQSTILNLPTYPGESIYLPDMLLAIVALANYSNQHQGEYCSTVNFWIERAKREWIDHETGLLASFLIQNGDSAEIDLPIKGSYSALNCYYLSLIDTEFAKEQYECLKKNFKQQFLLNGIKEYHQSSCWLDMDIDAGPIIFNLSPSGTAFAIGCATSLGDIEFRNQLLKTAEVFGSTISWCDKTHYLLANIALVGEAIVLAMRTSAPQTIIDYKK